MDKNKLATIILISIIALLCFYVAFSASRQRRDIKRLNTELKVSTDSLLKIQQAYTKLEANYRSIYQKLDSTRNKFNEFHNDLDSLIHTQISSLSKLNQKLSGLIKDEKPIPPIPEEAETFKFE